MLNKNCDEVQSVINIAMLAKFLFVVNIIKTKPYFAVS